MAFPLWSGGKSNRGALDRGSRPTGTLGSSRRCGERLATARRNRGVAADGGCVRATNADRADGWRQCACAHNRRRARQFCGGQPAPPRSCRTLARSSRPPPLLFLVQLIRAESAEESVHLTGKELALAKGLATKVLREIALTAGRPLCGQPRATAFTRDPTVDAFFGDANDDGKIGLSNIFSSIVVSDGGKTITLSGGVIPVDGHFTDIANAFTTDGLPFFAGVDTSFGGVFVPEPATGLLLLTGGLGLFLARRTRHRA